MTNQPQPKERQMANDRITVDGTEYQRVKSMSSTGRVIIRSRDSGVHYGTLESRDGTEVTLTNARRLWSWSGAASLSELATAGVAYPENCEFTVRVPVILVTGVCEVITCTEAAELNIEEVPEWKMH